MKKLLILLLPALLLSCNRVATDDAAEKYTQTVYSPEYATGFALKSLPDDTTALALEVYRPDTMQIVIPSGGFNTLLCMSTTYIGALSELGQAEKVVAVSGRDYVTNEAVKQRAVEVGYDGAMNYEALLSAKPAIALIYGVGGETPLAAKLDELSVPYVYVNDFEEQNPLGRAEWIVAIGALVGVDGRDTFKRVADAYNPVSDSITTVMLNTPYSGSWFIPGKDNYMSRLLTDAGASVAVSQPEGVESRPIDLEKALPALKKTRIWLFPGQAESLEQLRTAVPKADFDGAVWRQTGDFYETGAVRPDLILDELKTIICGEAPDSLHYFYRLR